MRLSVRVFRLAPSLGAVALSAQLDATYLSSLDPRIFATPRSVRLALFLLRETWRVLNLDRGNASIHNRNLLARKPLPSVLRTKIPLTRSILLISSRCI